MLIDWTYWSLLIDAQYFSAGHTDRSKLTHLPFGALRSWSLCLSNLQSGVYLCSAWTRGWGIIRHTRSLVHISCSCLLCVLGRFSHVRLFVTLWTVACQAPLSMGILQARILEWVAISYIRDLPDQAIEPKSPALAGRFFTTWEALSCLNYLAILCISWKPLNSARKQISSKQNLNYYYVKKPHVTFEQI